MTDAISRSDIANILRGKSIDTEADVKYVAVEIHKWLRGLDAVPVVRCNDCKYRCTLVCPMYHTETCLDDLDGFDDYNVDRTDDDGFCHLGERGEGEEDD